MAERYCQGCGAQIQSAEPNNFGFVPDHLLTEDSILCQRCFRINHYGRDELGAVSAQDSLDSISAGVAWASGVVLVVDLIDFESGFPSELVSLVQDKPMILAVNKVDLIPKPTPLQEVEFWVAQRLKDYGLPKVKVCLVSAVTGYGFPALADSILTLGKKVIFAGVTNVGKSSVLQRLLQMRLGGRKWTNTKPTVSPYPGTTVSVSRWHCPGDLVLADSPGYVPVGRISDLVSSQQAVEIIPHRSLSSHLYPIKVGDLVVIKDLCAVECLEVKGEGLLIGFTGSGVHWQKSSIKHGEKWLDPKWQGYLVRLRPREDLVINGLGWVSARKAEFKLRLSIPQQVEFSVRPNLIGPKK
ncbi:MAG: GTPase RsgA [Firmicutes bacterium]|nr:GTPase RsgA [Bacillota bacterium]